MALILLIFISLNILINYECRFNSQVLQIIYKILIIY